MSLLLQLAGEEVKNLAFSQMIPHDDKADEQQQMKFFSEVFWSEVVEYFTNSLQEKDSRTLSTSLSIKLNVNSSSVFLLTDKWQMMNW